MTTESRGVSLSAARTLADFTAEGLMIPQLRGQDPVSVIQELSQVLQRENRIPDLLPFYHSALNRELMVSTNLEFEMAFPHARVPGLKEVSFAVGRSDVPMGWGAGGVGLVRLVFLMAVPETDASEYLLLIAGLVRLAKDGRLVDRLRGARSPSQMRGVLEEVGLRPGAAGNPAGAVPH